MTHGWTIIEEPAQAALILRHPNGAEAHFSYSRIGNVMLPNRTVGQLPSDPFVMLAWLLRNGLRPYKVVGDMPVDVLGATRMLEDKTCSTN